MAVHYERLSHLDKSFLALETRALHFHVGAVAIFDAGSFATPEGGIDIGLMRDFVESKLYLVPRYRQRLAWVPIEGRPVWVDDEYFNIEHHVRNVALPRPGSDDQLKTIAGRLMSQQLDRSKPLWEVVVIEGLEGDRFALVAKFHHAMIDGLSGMDLMAMLMSAMPTTEFEPGPVYEPRQIPNGTELVVRETTRRISGAISSMRGLRELLDDAAEVSNMMTKRLKAIGASLQSGWLAPTGSTPINGQVTPDRRVDWLSTPLDEVKAVKNRLGGTVNDAILAIVAGGVRHFLMQERGMDAETLETTEFRAMVPVSVRGKDQRLTLGNQIAMWLIELPIGESDPVKRHARVVEETHELKETNQALGAATLVQISAGAPTTLVSLGARLAANATPFNPFNMTVTNVPGPQFPLYLYDAKLLKTYPLVPLWEGHGVGVALFSYDGFVDWGLNGDFDLMPDIDEFAASLDAAFDELVAAARGEVLVTD
jgi:diacylglycerol O-acyltransferase / wax synthase